VRRLAGLVDDALGHPDPFDVVDVGAGRGELLSGLADVPPRWRLTGVDLAPDPGRRTRGPGVGWRADVPPVTGLLIANEWLDDVPLEVTFDGRRVLGRRGRHRVAGRAGVAGVARLDGDVVAAGPAGRGRD
jgi:hypothetical protein